MKPGTFRLNPQHRWVEKVLMRWWPVLEEIVGPRWMPWDVEPELSWGCGSYGCVFPTPESGIVCKVTSDMTEAAFVSAAMSLGKWPDGIVRYHKIFQLEDEHYYQRPVYVLWRQAAEGVGELYAQASSDWHKQRYGPGSCRSFIELLSQFQKEAARIRRAVLGARDKEKFLMRAQFLEDKAWDRYRTVGGHGVKGAELVAYKRLECRSLAHFMMGEECGGLVGGALDFYLDQDLLLADLHLGNIGEAIPEDYEDYEVVITDPGHMVPLSPRWLEVDVPLLEKD